MGFVYIFIGTLMWSLDTLIRYPLLAHLSADIIVFFEHLTLVFIFGIFLFVKKTNLTRFDKSDVISFSIIGILGSAVSTLAFTKAFSLINPSLVILLQKLQPFVAVSLSYLLLKEKMNSRFFLYGLFAFLGAFLISFPDIAPLFQTGPAPTDNNQSLLGYALTLLAVVGWGSSTVFGKKLILKNYTESEVMAGRFIFGFIFLMIWVMSQNAQSISQITPDQLLKIFLMVVISGLIGMYIYYKGLKILSAHMSSVAELFFPLSAVAINWIFLQKSLQPVQISGAVMLLISAYLVQKKRPV